MGGSGWVGSYQQWAGPKSGRAKIGPIFRDQILVAQPVLKTGLIGPNSLLKVKKIQAGRAIPDRAILGRTKFDPVFFGPII